MFDPKTLEPMDIAQLEARADAIDNTDIEKLSTDELTALSEERNAIAKKLAEKRLEAFRADMRRAQAAGMGRDRPDLLKKQ